MTALLAVLAAATFSWALSLHFRLRERKSAAEKIALLQEAEKKLSDAFDALSHRALKVNNEQFLQLAREQLQTFQEAAKGDLEKRQQAIVELVKPVKESLDKVDTKLKDIETARAGAYAGLSQQVKSMLEAQNALRAETGNLVKALRTPSARGRWGEIQLQRVVEMAGMVEHCDFLQQPTLQGEDGRLRPDLVVKLPLGKTIVVDSKTPLQAYLEAVEAADESVRAARLADHARQVRQHITALSRKAYWDQFEEAPEFVVLFLPNEAIFSAALEQDPRLIEVGVAERVLLATPTTLIALLRAVAYGWRQEGLARDAQEIATLGRELHKRLATMGEHFGKVGRSLASAVGAYNAAVGSLEHMVAPAARRLGEKAAPGDPEPEALPDIDLAPRALRPADPAAALPDDAN